MRTLLLFLLLSLLSQTYPKKSNNRCFEYKLNEKDEEVAQDVRRRIENKEGFSKDCLISLINRGFFTAAVELYQSYFLLKQSKDLKNIQSDLKTILTNHRRELDSISNVLLSSNLNEMPTTYPVYSWAQSRDHVLLFVKFAHRMDSPACVNIKSENVTFLNDSVILRALCITGHKPLQYELNLTFFDAIDVERSTWNKEIGNFQFNMTKNETNKLWRRFLKDDLKTQIWFEMKKYVARDMEDYFRMLEDEQKEKDRLIEEERREQRRKAKKEKKKKSED